MRGNGRIETTRVMLETRYERGWYFTVGAPNGKIYMAQSPEGLERIVRKDFPE